MKKIIYLLPLIFCFLVNQQVIAMPGGAYDYSPGVIIRQNQLQLKERYIEKNLIETTEEDIQREQEQKAKEEKQLEEMKQEMKQNIKIN